MRHDWPIVVMASALLTFIMICALMSRDDVTRKNIYVEPASSSTFDPMTYRPDYRAMLDRICDSGVERIERQCSPRR